VGQNSLGETGTLYWATMGGGKEEKMFALLGGAGNEDSKKWGQPSLGLHSNGAISNSRRENQTTVVRQLKLGTDNV